jgi:hypothetical protein
LTTLKGIYYKEIHKNMSEMTENNQNEIAYSSRQYLPFEDEVAAIDERIEDL